VGAAWWRNRASARVYSGLTPYSWKLLHIVGGQQCPPFFVSGFVGVFRSVICVIDSIPDSGDTSAAWASVRAPGCTDITRDFRNAE
ncbi:MAG TPA: hypothetical protein DCR20_14400, partial [Planctomycetaceae bacterium]|nr:hypothetical protein [Planctomycetaceae bacterium]